MLNLKILQREIPECNFIYEVVHSGLEFREEVRAGPKYCILCKSLINFILLNVGAEDIWRMCGEEGRNKRAEMQVVSLVQEEQKDSVKTFYGA